MKAAITAPAIRIALYEGIGSIALAGARRAELVKTLLEKGYAVTCVRPGSPVSSIFAGELVVLGEFTEEKPREAEANDGNVILHFRQISGLDANQVAQLAEDIRAQRQAFKPGTWKP